jgi:hypothetical protein
MLGHDKAHKVQSVKRNFMLRELQKMTIGKLMGCDVGIFGMALRIRGEFLKFLRSGLWADQS